MFDKKTIRDIDVANKNVLVRVDYNVPIENGKVTDDLRIKESLATIRYLLERGARKIFLISHLGRPDGKTVPELSLAPVADKLRELLELPVSFAETKGEEKVVLLENLRFSPQEEENDAEFAKKLVELTKAELFVQDGFGVVHRAHASTVAITQFLPSVAGFLLEKEVENIKKAVENPARPLLFILGGAKVDDKVPLLNRFQTLADTIAIGGKIANTYQKTSDKEVLPVDFVYGEDGKAYDIGEKSTEKIIELINVAQTIIWNGTLGMTEDPRFAKASERVATAIGQSKAFSIIGGGDTAGFVLEYQKSHPELRYSLISTGGGASLELMSGEELPGVKALLTFMA
ncbi:MAG: phosphoglycerate kinase [Candidatus Nomurabacteria bacterium]|jgi:phosphoglycerate kinase|nr:phosphoglycerate kinase [Candidatus Nomurabacteria bacterium]